MTARRAPPRWDNVTTGRGGPRRASRAASATVVELSGASSATDVAGGSESHTTPASAPARAEDPVGDGCRYQSPSRRLVPGQSRTDPLGAKGVNGGGWQASSPSASPASCRPPYT